MGVTQARRIQKVLEDHLTFLEEVKEKDIDFLDDGGYLTSEAKKLGIDFLYFVEGFYDLDANYTDEGLSEVGNMFLVKYKDKYKYTCQ